MTQLDLPESAAPPGGRAEPGRGGWRALIARVNWPGLLVLAGLAAAWQITAQFMPRFLFPPIQDIVAATIRLLDNPALLGSVTLTYTRILAAVGLSFLLATALGIAAGVNALVARAAAPVIQLAQGVPAICWIIFAILWFRNNEVRIAFIVLISTAPSFFFQARDAVLSISPELKEMVRALRPTRWQTIRKLVLPALTPVMLTAILINLGTATKVGVTAELLAATTGIGTRLRHAQEQFRMDEAIAWTIPLVVFILATHALTNYAHRRFLRWRPKPGHSE